MLNGIRLITTEHLLFTQLKQVQLTCCCTRSETSVCPTVNFCYFALVLLKCKTVVLIGWVFQLPFGSAKKITTRLSALLVLVSLSVVRFATRWIALHGVHHGFPVNHRLSFLARDSMLSALYAIARPSVRLSVRPSHGWISRKRLNLGACNFHHTVAPSL